MLLISLLFSLSFALMTHQMITHSHSVLTHHLFTRPLYLFPSLVDTWSVRTACPKLGPYI